MVLHFSNGDDTFHEPYVSSPLFSFWTNNEMQEMAMHIFGWFTTLIIIILYGIW